MQREITKFHSEKLRRSKVRGDLGIFTNRFLGFKETQISDLKVEDDRELAEIVYHQVTKFGKFFFIFFINKGLYAINFLCSILKYLILIILNQ